MHSCQAIEENRCFSNGDTNLHIHPIAQGRPEENQVEFIQGPHGIVNPPKNLVLNNIRRFTMEHIGAANGLQTFDEILTPLNPQKLPLLNPMSKCSPWCHGANLFNLCPLPDSSALYVQN